MAGSPSAFLHSPSRSKTRTTVHLVLLSGGGLLGLVAPQLGLGAGLDDALGTADGGDALDGGGAEIATVATLGGLVGDGTVDPI